MRFLSSSTSWPFFPSLVFLSRRFFMLYAFYVFHVCAIYVCPSPSFPSKICSYYVFGTGIVCVCVISQISLGRGADYIAKRLHCTKMYASVPMILYLPRDHNTEIPVVPVCSSLCHRGRSDAPLFHRGEYCFGLHVETVEKMGKWAELHVLIVRAMRYRIIYTMSLKNVNEVSQD